MNHLHAPATSPSPRNLLTRPTPVAADVPARLPLTHAVRRGAHWMAWVAVAALAGCASSTPAPVLLTLPPAVQGNATAPSSPAPAATQAGTLVVRRMGLPEYLVSRRVRYRADASTLAEWPNTFWAERIEIGVLREFTSALRQQLPGWTLCEATCTDQPAAMTLQVDIVPMDFMRSTRRLQAGVHIVLSGASARPGPRQSRHLAYDIPVTGDTPQAHAQALTELLRQVAQTVPTMVTQSQSSSAP